MKFLFDEKPNFSFSKSKRNTLDTSAKYDYYAKADFVVRRDD